MSNEDIIKDLIEVRLANSEDFLKVKETLTRIGIAPKGQKKLFQSCHILHKQSRYFIVHFKELLALDGKTTNFSLEDKKRRNTIASLLGQWGLVEIIDDSKVEDKAPMSMIKIVPHKEKHDWELNQKYRIGHKK